MITADDLRRLGFVSRDADWEFVALVDHAVLTILVIGFGTCLEVWRLNWSTVLPRMKDLDQLEHLLRGLGCEIAESEAER